MEDDFTVQRLYKQNKVQQKEIKQLQAELDFHRWVPVAERLPEDGRSILLYCNKLITTGYWDDGQWQIYGSKSPREYYQKDITHWRLIILPEGE